MYLGELTSVVGGHIGQFRTIFFLRNVSQISLSDAVTCVTKMLDGISKRERETGKEP